MARKKKTDLVGEKGPELIEPTINFKEFTEQVVAELGNIEGAFVKNTRTYEDVHEEVKALSKEAAKEVLSLVSQKLAGAVPDVFLVKRDFNADIENHQFRGRKGERIQLTDNEAEILTKAGHVIKIEKESK